MRALSQFPWRCRVCGKRFYSFQQTEMPRTRRPAVEHIREIPATAGQPERATA
jgi:hypothetical protein